MWERRTTTIGGGGHTRRARNETKHGTNRCLERSERALERHSMCGAVQAWTDALDRRRCADRRLERSPQVPLQVHHHRRYRWVRKRIYRRQDQRHRRLNRSTDRQNDLRERRGKVMLVAPIHRQKVSTGPRPDHWSGIRCENGYHRQQTDQTANLGYGRWAFFLCTCVLQRCLQAGSD